MKPLLKYGRLLLWGLILVGFSFNQSVQAAGPTLSIDDYWQKMQETHTSVASLEDASLEAQQTQLATLADQWQRITLVTLLDGTQLSVDHSFLVSQLRADPPDLARLNGLLTALLTTRDTWPQAKHGSQDAEIFRSILARPEFQWQTQQPSPLLEWWQQLQQRFWQFIASLFPENTVISLNSSLFRYALTGLAILALIMVLAFTLRGILIDFVTEAEVGLDAETHGEVLTADSAFKQAQRLSNVGDYRIAVRYLYLSSLLLLEERGLLRYDRSQTNREYLRSVSHLPKLATILREVIEVFDQVWYGYQHLDETAYNRYAAQVIKLRQQK